MSAATKTIPSHLISGRLLARNTLWNLVGQGAPLVVAAVAIPLLIKEIGMDRFGVLSLAWMLIGYFGLIDLGVGRALTKLVADRLGTAEEREIPALVWTALALMLLLGVVGGLVMVLLSPWLAERALKIHTALQAESLRTFYVLSLGIPVVVLTSGLRGILEAQQLFGVVNSIRIPMGAFTFAGPLLVLPFSHSLVPLVVVLLVGRTIGGVVHLLVCLRAMPSLRENFSLRRALIPSVLSFGGWLTVSNIVSPVMQTMDRFLIAGLLSVTAVAYYSAPFDMVSRLSIFPAALAGVLFPAFATSYVQDHNRMARLLVRGVKFVFLLLFPIVLIIVTLAPEGLRFWLGETFAQHSATVLRWLAGGVFINCLALVPFTFIQGVGHPEITAKLHLVELPVYLAAAWWLIRIYGIEGAAIAWSGRVTLDAIVLFAVTSHFLPDRGRWMSRMSLVALAGLSMLVIATLPRGILLKAVFLFVSLLTFALTSWFVFLATEERALVRLQHRQTVPVAD